MRKLYLGLSLICSTTTFAGSMGLTNPVLFNGFYAGGSIGAANLINKESTLYEPGLYDRHQFSATGVVGGGLLGYDYSFTETIKLGVEGFINATGLNVAAEQKYVPYSSFNANMRYNTGVRILPGYAFSPGTIGHLLLGYSYGKFNIKDNGNYGYIDKGISSNGFQTGLGFSVPCYFKNLSLRADTIYTKYSPNTALGLSTSLAPQNYHDDFSTIEANLSLIYKFG